MRTRTGLRAGGSNADNHNFGPDVQIGSHGPIPWRFSIGRSWFPGLVGRILRVFGLGGKHRFSPPMTRTAAKEGAALMLQGDEGGARERWGEAVTGWLDGLSDGARGACYEAARELMRG